MRSRIEELEVVLKYIVCPWDVAAAQNGAPIGSEERLKVASKGRGVEEEKNGFRKVRNPKSSATCN